MSYFTLDNVEKAVAYLVDSEDEYARLKALISTEKKKLEIELASLKIESPETSDAKSDTWAKSQPAYQKAVDLYHDVLESFYLLDAKRHRAELVVEIWRSVNSARSRGNPT